MKMAKFAYIRTSTLEQNENRQIIEMEKQGVTKEFMFIEKQSGKNFEDRPIYREMKRRLTNTDILYIESLSRLGRNRDQVVKEFEELNQICAGVVILNMPFLSTADLNDTGIGKLITKIFVEVIAWSDEEDRLEKKRMQRQGIDIALKDPTKYKGKRKVYKLDSPDVVQALEWIDEGKMTRRDISKITKISPATLYRLVKERDALEAAKLESEK